jgi:hypothetical protein
MWRQMLDRLDAFERDDVTLRRLVSDLRGLYVEADPHDPSVRTNFERAWSSLDAEHELRTETWAPSGAASEEGLRGALDDFRFFLNGVLSGDWDGEHR